MLELRISATLTHPSGRVFFDSSDSDWPFDSFENSNRQRLSQSNKPLHFVEEQSLFALIAVIHGQRLRIIVSLKSLIGTIYSWRCIRSSFDHCQATESFSWIGDPTTENSRAKILAPSPVYQSYSDEEMVRIWPFRRSDTKLDVTCSRN